jgi:hypothetical protein
MDHRLADIRYQSCRFAKEMKKGGGSRKRTTCSPALPLHSTDTSSTRFLTRCRQISETQFSSPDEVSVGGPVGRGDGEPAAAATGQFASEAQTKGTMSSSRNLVNTWRPPAGAGRRRPDAGIIQLHLGQHLTFRQIADVLVDANPTSQPLNEGAVGKRYDQAIVKPRDDITPVRAVEPTSRSVVFSTSDPARGHPRLRGPRP